MPTAPGPGCGVCELNRPVKKYSEKLKRKLLEMTPREVQVERIQKKEDRLARFRSVRPLVKEDRRTMNILYTRNRMEDEDTNRQLVVELDRQQAEKFAKMQLLEILSHLKAKQQLSENEGVLDSFLNMNAHIHRKLRWYKDDMTKSCQRLWTKSAPEGPSLDFHPNVSWPKVYNQDFATHYPGPYRRTLTTNTSPRSSLTTVTPRSWFPAY